MLQVLLSTGGLIIAVIGLPLLYFEVREVVIYELIRAYKGKSQTEYSGQLLYKHLQPRQELFMLEGEERWRDIAEEKSSLLRK